MTDSSLKIAANSSDPRFPCAYGGAPGGLQGCMRRYHAHRTREPAVGLFKVQLGCNTDLFGTPTS